MAMVYLETGAARPCIPRRTLSAVLCGLTIMGAQGAVRIDRYETFRLAVSGVFSNGAVTAEVAPSPAGPWTPLANAFTTNVTGSVAARSEAGAGFHRIQAWDFAGGDAGFTNVVYAYGLLSAVAGAGSTGDDSNEWLAEFENGSATNARLSTPHMAMADTNGNVFIADKDAHAIRKVTVDGRIITVAGVNVPGNAPDGPTVATLEGLNAPNGLFVQPDGTFYILDLNNGKIRRVDTNGTMSTLFTVPGGIAAGRGLWVDRDETEAYVCCGTAVKHWSPADGVSDYATNFVQLGNLTMDPQKRLVVTDRGGHSVWRLESGGAGRVRIAGNGTNTGGGDGAAATATGLDGVRAVCFFPTGAFLVGTHAGSQVWYVDIDGIIHLFLNGDKADDAHGGDGTWFYAPGEQRVSEIRALALTPVGDILITENDRGYVRRVRFLPW